MNLLEQLWSLADDIAASERTDGKLFGECGLFLVRPLVRWDYFCTPLNTLTFANTGGDGVHYGFLQSVGVPDDELPVVMTVPMSDHYNIIVAESLREFLGIGYFVGWFLLEQLAYDESWAVSHFSRADVDTWDQKEKQLSLIRDILSISHIALSLRRIQYLNDKYLSLLLLPESTAPDS